jgi:hypothetical protein
MCTSRCGSPIRVFGRTFRRSIFRGADPSAGTILRRRRPRNLYPATAKALAAACRKLGIETNVGHWKAALRNVREFAKHNDTFALALGSGATIKSLFDEALINAGVTDRPTILVERNRKTALRIIPRYGR